MRTSVGASEGLVAFGENQYLINDLLLVHFHFHFHTILSLSFAETTVHTTTFNDFATNHLLAYSRKTTEMDVVGSNPTSVATASM